jgi:hypothetical protein
MKKLIRKLLREYVLLLNETMVPINNEFHEHGDANYITIAQDDTTNNFLMLFVELHKEGNYQIYSYYFQVFNENGEALTKRLYTREDTSKYLPQEIKGTIIPLVKEITINLINRIKPLIIKRTAMEDLNEKGMVRYNEISNLLQNELGYKLVWQGKDYDNKESWKFVRDGVEQELNESNIEKEYKFESSELGKILHRADMNLREYNKKHPLILYNSSKNGGIQYSELIVASQRIQDELGFKLIWQGRTDDYKQGWTFQKNGIKHELNENTIIDFSHSIKK